ncbi:MAG: M48 family metallopeptidase [Oligoflexia bacterium]|nr:M48 family metallopeptidase [Oligoflexia bacterium]
MRFKAVFAIITGLLVACTTSPLGRKQLLLVPDSTMNAMGAQAFQELKSTTPAETSDSLNAYVQCVAKPVTEAAKAQLGEMKWEIVVFRDQTANAFALPGGKIGVHSGLLNVAITDAQLAAVLGHEVGHVIAKHGAERVSESLAAQGGLAIVDAFILGKSVGQEKKGLIMGALGLGAQFGILHPHSRGQESEADLIGLDLMSRAGFDPSQSVDLWRNMARQAGGKAPPEFLSTHPANQSRIDNLQAHLPESLPKYQAAQAEGRRPNCKRP